MLWCLSSHLDPVFGVRAAGSHVAARVTWLWRENVCKHMVEHLVTEKELFFVPWYFVIFGLG